MAQSRRTQGFTLPDLPPDLKSAESIALGLWMKRVVEELVPRFNAPADLRLSNLHVSPERPREGQLVYADGTDWNPSATGAGLHVFDGTNWDPFLVGTIVSQLLTILTTRGDILYRDASSAVRKALGASGTLLRSDGTDLVYSTLSAYLDAVFTGEANGDLVGRTGGSWVNRTLAAVLGDMATTRGDIIRRGSSAVERLALGASGTIFRSDGTDAVWATVATALATLLTTRGDIVTRDASNVIRLALGAANTFLGSDGTDASWRTAAQVLASLNIVVGTYAPTMTLVANLDSASASALNYIRIGTIVFVFGLIAADSTATSATSQLGISLPIASNFGAGTDAGGVGTNGTTAAPVRISADSTNDRLAAVWDSGSTAGLTIGIIAGYRII